MDDEKKCEDEKPLVDKKSEEDIIRCCLWIEIFLIFIIAIMHGMRSGETLWDNVKYTFTFILLLIIALCPPSPVILFFYKRYLAIATVLLTIFFGFINPLIDSNERTCYDRTSIDYNRQNDMKCIDKDGNIKRTDYDGAKKLMGKG